MKNDRNTFEGRLPAQAPLANPYVPFQLENPTMYGPKEGLVRGTLFPGLDLPFMGMVNQEPRDFSPLMQLQSMAFGLQELALYLDTHPDDEKALDFFKEKSMIRNEALKAYAAQYGPLTIDTWDDTCSRQWDWVMQPWPWEGVC